MISVTINQTRESGIAAAAKRVLETLTSFGKNWANSRTPILLDKNALWEMGITPQEVEKNLHSPPWRGLGRYL